MVRAWAAERLHLHISQETVRACAVPSKIPILRCGCGPSTPWASRHRCTTGPTLCIGMLLGLYWSD
jgi:hypothetical protein